MKAAYFDAHGGLDVLKVGELPAPALGPGDVRIRVKACALNHLDLFVREGWHGLKLPMPHVGGTDVAGVVSEVAPDVRGVKMGDEVIVNPGLNFEADADGRQITPGGVSIVGETRWGGLAEECVVPATHVLPKPVNMSWEEAAALPLTAITASQMVKRKANVKPGDKVLVLGAGGGVGVMAVQIAKVLGAWVVATTGGADKIEKVRALGADEVIDYHADENWSKTAFLLSGKTGYDVIIDSVGAATWKFSLRSLRNGGRLVTCGATTGPIGETDIRLIFWKQLSILGSTMGVPADLEDALAWWKEGRLKVVVDSVWPLENVGEAQAYLDGAKQFGKVVLTP